MGWKLFLHKLKSPVTLPCLPEHGLGVVLHELKSPITPPLL
jgi:hypothetical protein